MLIPALVFLGVLGIIVGAYQIFVVRPERRLVERLQPKAVTRRVVFLKKEEDEAVASAGPLRRVLAGARPFVAPSKALVEESGLPITVATFFLMIGVAGLAGYVLALLMTRQVSIGVVAALVAGWLPLAYVRYVRTNRLRKFEEQLPEAIDLIARALRAGHALTTGLGMVADEFPAPLGREFRTLYDEQNFGLTLQEAMHNFARRVPVLDARFFVTAVLTQRETGGNLAEVLDNLARVMRTRFRVKRQVRVISTHGRLSGWVLIMMPPALSVGFLIISSNHMQTLVNDPLGVRMIWVALLLQLTGTLIIRRIVNVEY